MMTSVSLALVLSLAALSTALPVQDKSQELTDKSLCLVGPSFWCQSEATMKLCSAEAHCMESRRKSVSSQEESVAAVELAAAAAAVGVDQVMPKIVENDKSVSVIMDGEEVTMTKATTMTKTTTPSLSVDPCALCEEIANITIVVAESTEGKAAAKMILAEACKRMPTPLEQKVCDMLVNPIVDAIYDAIEAHVNVTAKGLCTSMRLCGAEMESAKKAIENRLSIFKDAHRLASAISSSSSPSSSSSSSSSPSSSSPIAVDPCELCLEIANATLQIADSPAGKAAAKVIVGEACKALPNPIEQNICHLLVNPVIDAIYDALEKHVHVTAKEICADLRLCSAETSTGSGSSRSSNSGPSKSSFFKNHVASVMSSSSSAPEPFQLDPCALCLEISNLTLEVAESPAGKAAAKVIIGEACKALPNPIEQNICHLLINPIVDAIFDALEKHVHVTAQQLCTDLRLCSATKLSSNVKAISPKYSLLRENTASAISSSSSSSQIQLDPCALCLEISNVTLEVAESPAGKAAAKVIIGEACKALPNPIEQNICHLLINPIVDAIFDALEKHVHVTAQQVCTDLRLCSGRTSGSSSISSSSATSHAFTPSSQMNRLKMAIKSKKNKEASKQKANPLECQVCQVVMQYLKGYATDDNKKTLVFYFNSTICEQMPPSVRKNCSDDVVKIVDELFNIVQTETPVQICQTVQACDAAAESQGPAQDFAAVMKAFPASPSPMQCRLCETAAAAAKSFATPENEEAALSFLDGALCGKLPAADRANCSKMLQMTVGNLFSMLNGLTPRRFCEQIGVCGGSEGNDEISKTFPAIGNNVECELCQFASQTIAPYCTPANAKSVVDMLNTSICQKYVTPAQRPLCSKLVQNATKEIFQLVSNGRICSKLAICPERKSQPWERVVEVVKAAKIEANAKKIGDEANNSGYDIVINNINNNIMNVNNNVVGNTIVVNNHVKADVPASPPSPPHPPKEEDALLSVKNPAECSVCEYVGLALLLGQTPEDACKTAFASQSALKLDACVGFATPFGMAIEQNSVENHNNLVKLCRQHKYC